MLGSLSLSVCVCVCVCVKYIVLGLLPCRIERREWTPKGEGSFYTLTGDSFDTLRTLSTCAQIDTQTFSTMEETLQQLRLARAMWLPRPDESLVSRTRLHQ